jgi:hypothetical protein
MKARIVRLFSVEKGVIKDRNVTAKVDFLDLREDNMTKAGFQDYDLATFWRNARGEYRFSLSA